MVSDPILNLRKTKADFCQTAEAPTRAQSSPYLLRWHIPYSPLVFTFLGSTSKPWTSPGPNDTDPWWYQEAVMVQLGEILENILTSLFHLLAIRSILNCSTDSRRLRGINLRRKNKPSFLTSLQSVKVRNQTARNWSKRQQYPLVAGMLRCLE